MGDVTQILGAIERGEPHAAEELVPLVYDELRRLAAARMACEAPGQTLQATALVHEAYLRLVGSPTQHWAGRRHFFAAAAEAMRRILIESARRKKRLVHGGHLERVEFEEANVPNAMPTDDLLALDDALDGLARVDPQAAQLIKLRFFVGMTHAQAAEVLGVSRWTADQDWAFGRAWLFREIQGKQRS
jgi:RNA polymerase sigma factor (TIGR02999 family)